MNREYLCKSVGFLVLLFITSYAAIADTLQINQVYYDPIATESGGEAIELYNPNNFSVNLSGYTIKTESADKDITFASNHAIAAKAYFLIADIGWNISKDNNSWINADYEETMNMYNTDSGIALVDSAGNILDAVGWGDKSLISQGLYETEPSLGVKTGYVLLRNQDTNNNKNDFIESLPKFRNSFSSANITNTNSSSDNKTSLNLSNGNNVSITLIINNTAPFIDEISLTDDNKVTAGIQILPLAGKNKTIAISVIARDNNGVNDLAAVKALIVADTVQEIELVKNQTIDSTKALFTAVFELPYFLSPSVYNVAVTAYDAKNAQVQAIADFEYLQLTAVAFDSANYKMLETENNTASLLGDAELTTLDKPTLQNLGNTKLNFALATKGLFNGNSNLPAENMSYNFGLSNPNKSFTNSVVFDSDTLLDKTQNIAFNLFLTLPAVLSSGLYTGDITLYAIAAED
ncbi:lamin tail domain-containing protein [Candidatus Woesearchaeota archaeon]|nr:lamin tail domain-containing protein [Candidatus Woesearchaeota archaeon]